jgi:uncharacterized repeat protein (TIGR03803 family)
MFSRKSSRLKHRSSGLVLAILCLAASSVASTGAASAQTLTTLVNFGGANGEDPYAGLIADPNGDLFGTTVYGGASDEGSMFEILKTSAGYANTPTTLASFNGTDGAMPIGTPKAALVADAYGNLFGTTYEGGAFNDGTVFEIANTSSGYASTPTTVVSFDGTNGANPFAGLTIDAKGDLFGTTFQGGLTDGGTVFEIVNTSSGYATTPTTLVSFNAAIGQNPLGGLIADAKGDLFGTTEYGGASYSGTVFEIVNTSSGYATTPTTLVSFNGTDGAYPSAGLIADANGDLFGTTEYGGASNDGTVFEIANTSSGYASTPTTLVSFNGTDGANPFAGLIADGKGNLFGTDNAGGPSDDGTVFEVAKTSSGYASTPTVLVNFNGTNGANPKAGLVADMNGNLFGTTYDGGASDVGTVFEVTGSGFVPLFTPFASFQADLVISTARPYGYALVGDFTTTAANTTINPKTEAVTIEIANYTVTIPAGSFQAIFGAYVYQGTINGVTNYLLLTPFGKNQYAFAVVGSPENLSVTTNPVTVGLIIGTNAGTSQVNEARVP